MAKRGTKKKKSNYSDHIRVTNKKRKLNKHLNKIIRGKKVHANDKDAQKALKAAQSYGYNFK